MNVLWPVIAMVSVILALFFELLSQRKERNLRKKMQLEPDQEWARERLFSRFLLVTALGALLGAFFLIAFNIRWSLPKDSVAFVVDAGDEEMLLRQKGVVQELAHTLQGIPVSLYERGEHGLIQRVPPTIDRLYFSLICDGIQSSQGEALSLDWAQKEVMEKGRAAASWVIVISSSAISERTVGLDGATLLIPTLPFLSIESFEHGMRFRESSLHSLATRISSRILLSHMGGSINMFEKALLMIALAGSLVAAIQWRKRVVPLFWVSLFFVSTGLEGEILDGEGYSAENNKVQQSIDLVQVGEYAGAASHLEKLLPSVIDARARARILYNLALISYLRGDQQSALVWLKNVQKETVDEQLAQKCIHLRVRALVRLVQGTDKGEEWRKELRELLRERLDLSRALFAEASVALLLSPQHMFDEEKTLLFYVQSLRDLFPLLPSGTEAFSSFIQATKKEVEKRLENILPRTAVSMFSKACEKGAADPFFLFHYELWYKLSKSLSYDQAIQYLLAEALQTTTEFLYFPQRIPLLKKRIVDTEALLAKQVSLPTEDTAEALSAAWYVRARLWNFFQGEDNKNPEALVQFVAAERELSVCLLIQQHMARELISALSLPKSWYDERDPLSVLFWQAYLKWFAHSPLDALDMLLGRAEQNRTMWLPYVERLFGIEKEFFALPLDKPVSSYNVILLGRLAQAAQSSCSLPQEGAQLMTRILLLYKESLKELQHPEPIFWNTLSIILKKQGTLANKVLNSSLCKDNYTKKKKCENLVEEWTKRTRLLEKEVVVPGAVDVSAVQKEMERCYAIVLRIRQMFDEQEPSMEENFVPSPSYVQPKQLAIREEEAVRLYQEMDRMDRALYGE